MAKLLANSGDLEQMPHSVDSDLVCAVCQLPSYGSPDYNGLKQINVFIMHSSIFRSELSDGGGCHWLCKPNITKMHQNLNNKFNKQQQQKLNTNSC